jgi:transcription termination/antitermination protein NusG
MNNELSKWYALRVRPNWEKVVGRSLRGKGYEEFVPVYCSRMRVAGTWRDVELPLFQGYVFCQLDVQRRLPVLQTPGVQQIVGFGGTPMAIEEREIESVRRIVTSNSLFRPFPFYCVGQEVRVVRGPLAGVEGVVIHSKKPSFVVSVTLLQRSVEVELDVDWV